MSTGALIYFDEASNVPAKVWKELVIPEHWQTSCKVNRTMLKTVLDKKTGDLIRVEEATPICNMDFCDTCGACLYCHIEDDCGGEKDQPHVWVKYEDGGS